MSEKMLEDYAPKPTNVGNTTAEQIANVTIQAVDEIGEHTAKQIEKTAEDLVKNADAVANELKELAHAIREHTIKASEQVALFAQKSTHTVEVIRKLQERINGTDGSKPRVSTADSRNPNQTHRAGEVQKAGAGNVPQGQGQSKPDADPTSNSRIP